MEAEPVGLDVTRVLGMRSIRLSRHTTPDLVGHSQRRRVTTRAAFSDRLRLFWSQEGSIRHAAPDTTRSPT